MLRACNTFLSLHFLTSAIALFAVTIPATDTAAHQLARRDELRFPCLFEVMPKRIAVSVNLDHPYADRVFTSVKEFCKRRIGHDLHEYEPPKRTASGWRLDWHIPVLHCGEHCEGIVRECVQKGLQCLPPEVYTGAKVIPLTPITDCVSCFRPFAVSMRGALTAVKYEIISIRGRVMRWEIKGQNAYLDEQDWKWKRKRIESSESPPAN